MFLFDINIFSNASRIVYMGEEMFAHAKLSNVPGTCDQSIYEVFHKNESRYGIFFLTRGGRFNMVSLEQMVGLRVFSLELGAVTKLNKGNNWCAGAESWKATDECS